MLEKVTDRMRRLCSRREYCRADILKKAAAALDGNMEQAWKVVDRLVEEKYIDDVRYASAFARDKSALAGWGEVKIRYMLSCKGISKDDIDRALREVDSGRSRARMEKLLENKYKALKDDPQCRLKMLRFALGRGYDYEDAAAVIDELMS